jgi:hypothetical protein
MTRTSNLLGSAVVLCVLAGCGGAPADPAGSDSSDQQKSPLAEYMGDGFNAGGGGGMAIRIASGGGGQSSEEQLAQQRKMEELTAACMRDAGFEYVAVPPDGDPKSAFDEAYKLPPDKFAEQYGYGISTLMFGKADEDADDPNTAIRNKLSAQAQKAYDKALNGGAGNGVVIQGETKGDSGKPKDMGCRGKAAEQVFGKPKGADPGQEMRKFDSLFKDLEALRKRIDSDPRVTEAAKAWSDCMADARYPGLKKPEEAQKKVLSRMNALQGISPSPGSNRETRAIKPEDVDPAQLAELKKYELAIAKADYDCKQKGYSKAYTDVQFTLEREFVETHKTLLEQFRDWQAQLKGER